MTQLDIAVDADDELWTLDALPTPEAPYVEVESELVEVRSRFPSSYYTLTGETLPPRIRVRRGIAGTTKASHIQGSTLTPNYGLSGGGGGGAIAVTDGTTTVPEATSIEVSGADVTDGGGGVAQIGYVKSIELADGEQFTMFGVGLEQFEFIPESFVRFTVDGPNGTGFLVHATGGLTLIEASAIDNGNKGDVSFGTDTQVRFLGQVGFYQAPPVAQPNVPLTTPNVQDVIDALVALGLVEQSD